MLHSTEEDKNIEMTIRRILGHKWEQYFRFFTGCHLLLLSIITLDLIVDQLYAVIYSLCTMGGVADSIAKKTEF